VSLPLPPAAVASGAPCACAPSPPGRGRRKRDTTRNDKALRKNAVGTFATVGTCSLSSPPARDQPQYRRRQRRRQVAPVAPAPK
jgi:hypothetical protein